MAPVDNTPSESTEHDSILAMSYLELTLWCGVFMVACTGLTYLYAPESWGTLRILAGGSLLGSMSFYMLFINRLLVS